MASPRIRLCRDLRSAAAAVSRSRDVIVEILSWLPAKSLYRCRCVSKGWQALISSPAFAAAHRSRAEPLLISMSRSVAGTTTLQLMDTDGTVVRRFPPTEGYWTLRASLGDLACISSNYNRPVTLLVDLATGKVQLGPSEDVVVGVPMYSSCGRATRSGSLKLFRLFLPLPGLGTQLICKVLTLGLGDGAKWKQVQSPPTMVSHWYNSRERHRGPHNGGCRPWIS
ncbi:hypothetical protein ACQ4PT_027256 [Festuca glaucescens]